MRLLDKVISYQDLAAWREALSSTSRPLVVTNGCFDILHPGHLFLLANARGLGKTLLVGLTGDAAIRTLKGPSRPAMPEQDRLTILCGLESVSNVCLFPETDAVDFLKKSRPDVYVKGGDYTIETINPDERDYLESAGVRIEFIPRFESQSTSSIVQRIVNQALPEAISQWEDLPNKNLQA
jgi:rfaE bifunctional protein nucleotidyltransferase chain/domain